jgi:hypothetical protein
VDRKKSLVALQKFLGQRDAKIEEEGQWLQEHRVDVVLSDAGFLAWYVTVISDTLEVFLSSAFCAKALLPSTLDFPLF